MPHVSVHYKIYLTAGHHRQPRNASSTLEPNPPSEVDVAQPGNITPLYIPQLPFMDGTTPALSQLLFWSVTDGVNGQTFPAGPLTQPVGANPLTITAWYFPIGSGTGNGTAIIDDAFSAIAGNFIDDTFVTVTSDPSLTSDANVVGEVPTASAETLVAYASVASTTEPFLKWMSFSAGTASGTTLDVPAGSDGLAIAFYERPQGVPPPNLNVGRYEIGGIVVGGVIFDGGGGIILNGVYHPVDPWGPLLVALTQASLIVAASKGLSQSFRVQGSQLATRAVVETIRTALPVIEKGFQAGE
jgi:hypothetical protein